MELPKRTKFKKNRKGFLRSSKKTAPLLVNYKEGKLQLEALQFGVISAKQLDSCKETISKKIKKLGKCLSVIFPNLPVTKKPQETRMGKGKGSFHFWAFKVVPGSKLFEIVTDSNKKAFSAFCSAKYRLAIKIKVRRQN
jgi:large subunit ribosomal protein L16